MRKLDPVKHEEKRREILYAAGRCFARDGFRGATISAICAEAGISPGHLYHYFPSKEEIVSAITAVGLEYAAARFSEMAQGGDTVATLFAEIDRVKAYQGPGSPLLVLDMLAEATRNPAMSAILTRHNRQVRDLLVAFLRHGQERGQVDPALDLDLAAAVLISLFDGSRTLPIRDPALDLPKAMALYRTVISRFLTPPGASA